MRQGYTLSMNSTWRTDREPTEKTRDIVVIYTTGDAIVTQWVDEVCEERTEYIVAWTYVPEATRDQP